jgi:hypothetical protein
VSSDFATKSALVQRAGSFLAAREVEILQLVGDLPADIRLALEDLIRQAPLEVPIVPEQPAPRPPRRSRPGGT